jgi:hypothetical protein
MASSGPNSPGTIVNDSSVGTQAWSNPSNAGASDNSYATSSIHWDFFPSTNYLKATNFGFSIPLSSTINGILVEVEKKTNTDAEDVEVKIIKGGNIGSTDKSISGDWPQTESYVSYGSSSDLWGETWDASDINDSTFGFVISAGNSANTADVNIDHIRITVYYTEATAGTTTGVQSMTGVNTITFGVEGDLPANPV